MIQSRITSKAQTTIPRAVRAVLGLKPGDVLDYRIEGAEVRIAKSAQSLDPFQNPFVTFTEWDTDADREAFRDL